MFTLAISCLTTSNLPWFMDVTFQVPMQCCSLQHQTLLPSSATSTPGHCFCFGSTSSFFLELFLHSSPAAYWAPTDLGSLSFSVIYFCLFILFMGFLTQEYWSGLPFPSPVDTWETLANVLHCSCSCSVTSPVWLFATPWTTTCQAFPSFTISQSSFKPTSTVSVMPSNYLILCHSLHLLPSVFPSIRVFSHCW